MDTLINTYHNSEYRTRKTWQERQAILDRYNWGTPSDADKAYIRRVERALCGIDTCLCGHNALSERY